MTQSIAIRPLARRDVAMLVRVLSRAYESSQNFELRLLGYLQMRSIATFVADLDGVPVGMVVGNHYGRAGYVSQMAVEPAVQRRGIGTLLMDGLVAWADACGLAAIELDATPAGAPLYARYGFVATERTDVYTNATDGLRSSGARRYVPADRAALLAADACAFGADRSEVLGLLLDDAPQAVWVLPAADGIRGYAVAQPRPELLGPVVARDPAGAAQLIDAARTLLASTHRISLPSANAAAIPIVAARGYRFARSLVHMVRGTRPAARREQLFARINLGQG